jgi:predicted membrane protein
MKEKYFFGIVLIIVGLGLFLEQLNLISFGNLISLYWPVILIILGLVGLFDRKSSKFWNGTLILVGSMLQINRLGLLDVNVFGFVVPIILIMLGLKVLMPKNEDNKDSKNDSNESNQE